MNAHFCARGCAVSALFAKEQQCIGQLTLFARGEKSSTDLHRTLFREWYEERPLLWHAAFSLSDRDFRPLARLLDAVYAEIRSKNDPEARPDLFRQWLSGYKQIEGIFSQPVKIRLFRQPIPHGWRHPCMFDDIQQQLANVPEQDLEGLPSIGLAPHCCSNFHTYGVYRSPSAGETNPPVILLYAVPKSLKFALGSNYSPGRIEQEYLVEQTFGMSLDTSRRSSITAYWDSKSYRKFVVEMVLMHEIGHHVQARDRWRQEVSASFPRHHPCEQFAEDHALRGWRESMNERSLSPRHPLIHFTKRRRRWQSWRKRVPTRWTDGRR